MAQCSATSKRSGEQCQRLATPGADVCVFHGSAAPQVRRAARRRLQEAELQRKLVDLLEDLDVDRQDRSAVEVLSSSVGRAADMAEALEVLVQQLRLVPGGVIETDEDLAVAQRVTALFGPDHLGDGAAHVAADMLMRWNQQAAQLAKMAIDVGLDERRLVLSEAIGRQIGEVFRGAMTSMRTLLAAALPPDIRAEVLRLWAESEGAVLRHHIAVVTAPGDDPPPLPAPPAEWVAVESVDVSKPAKLSPASRLRLSSS